LHPQGIRLVEYLSDLVDRRFANAKSQLSPYEGVACLEPFQVKIKGFGTPLPLLGTYAKNFICENISVLKLALIEKYVDILP